MDEQERDEAIVRIPVDMTRDRLQYMMAQIGVNLVSDQQSCPYRINTVHDGLALQKVIRAIAVARDERVDFLIFPEMSISKDWIEDILVEFMKCSYPLILILPLEHLPLDEFCAIVSNHPDIFHGTDTSSLFSNYSPHWRHELFVNSAIICFRNDNECFFVYQPKLFANEMEQPHKNPTARFLRGRNIRVIEAPGCRFAVAICFDMVARTTHTEPLQTLDKLQNSLYPDPVSLLFIPQLNLKPNHEVFIRAAERFYRNRPHQHIATSIINVNAGGLQVDGAALEGYGDSSIYTPCPEDCSFPYILVESDPKPEQGRDIESVRLPNPIKRLQLQQKNDWLIFVETLAPGQYLVQSSPGYDHTLCLRVMKWDASRSFQPTSLTPCFQSEE